MNSEAGVDNKYLWTSIHIYTFRLFRPEFRYKEQSSRNENKIHITVNKTQQAHSHEQRVHVLYLWFRSLQCYWITVTVTEIQTKWEISLN